MNPSPDPRHLLASSSASMQLLSASSEVLPSPASPTLLSARQSMESSPQDTTELSTSVAADKTAPSTATSFALHLNVPTSATATGVSHREGGNAPGQSPPPDPEATDQICSATSGASTTGPPAAAGTGEDDPLPQLEDVGGLDMELPNGSQAVDLGLLPDLRWTTVYVRFVGAVWFFLASPTTHV